MTYQLSTDLVEGSVLAKAQERGIDVAAALIDATRVVIIDTSGSMEAEDARDNQSRHDVAEQELRTLQKNYPGRIAVISFSDDVMFCPDGVPVRFNGGTNMVAALRYVKRLDAVGMDFILISDGEPTCSREETLQVASTFRNKIDCIYVGPRNDYYGRGGMSFLEELSAVTGGGAMQSASVAEFEQEVSLILEVDDANN